MSNKNQVSKTNLRPLAGYVLVEPSEPETKTASGILLPDTAQEQPAQGLVVAVGPNVFDLGREQVCPVKVGDRVVYKKWGGDELKLSGVEYKLVKFDDLMGVLE
jgi:chaperonin GroES